MVIKGYSVGPLLRKTGREVMEDRVPMLAASAAYHFFFSLFPLLLFLAPLVTLVGDEQRIFGFMMAQLTSALPSAQVAAIQPLLEKMVFSESAPALLSLGLILAAWSGSNIFGALMGALNAAYDVTETRAMWKRILLRLAMFVAGAVIMIAATVVFVRGEEVAAWIGGAVGMDAAAVTAWKILQLPIAALALVVLAFATLWLLPNVKQAVGHVAIASVATVILWLLATLVFRLYVQHFPPNPAYGFIGGVIIMLGWMYYTMLVVLVGGELASELHHGSGAVAPRAGAIYLERVVTSGGPGTPSTQRIEGKAALSGSDPKIGV